MKGGPWQMYADLAENARMAILHRMKELSVQRLRGNEEITAAYPLMSQLRPHLTKQDFTSTIRRQEAEGYELYGGYVSGELVVLGGVREQSTTARGQHLFVDDLVTHSAVRGSGFGQAMLMYLAQYAHQKGIAMIYLDSRDSAVGFYRQMGFTFLTSVPCWIEVSSLIGEEQANVSERQRFDDSARKTPRRA